MAFSLPGQPIRRLIRAVLTGDSTNPDSKPLITSKTQWGATIGSIIYPIGLQFGWWSVEDWEMLAVPLIGWLGTLWGRITAKKDIG